MDNNTRGQNSPPSYLDGISVKISEKYKPPKRISLALSYSQRITLNKLIQEPPPSYEFTLEESIKNRIHEWRKARLTLMEERKQRLQQINQENNNVNTWKANENIPGEQNEVPTDKVNSTKLNDNNINNKDTQQVIGPYYSSESGLLIPTSVASQQVNNMPTYQIHKDSFNFSEFESDTSSPFDNMELKTINDLEQLAEVLKQDSDKIASSKSQVALPKTAASISGPVSDTNYIRGINPTENIYNTSKYMYSNHIPSKPYVLNEHELNSSVENQINGFYYKHLNTSFISKPLYPREILSQHTDKSISQISSPISKESTVRSVPEIMKSLRADLSSNHNDLIAQSAPESSTSTFTHKKDSHEQLENPFNNLSPELQQMARKISSMGFPLSRVARTCQALSGNQKKVVEHLLALTDLLDLGFPEQKVANALLKCNNDRDKALDLLIS